MRRRAFLACAAAGVAGCLSDDPESSPAGGDRGTDTPVHTATATPTTAPTRTRTLARTGTPTPTPTGSPTPTRTRSPRPPALAGYDTTDVRATTPGGERLGRVRAAVSDTPGLRYTGLSDVEELPDDWGMLFVYDSVGNHTYVMREMDFGLDIVYADDEGAITEVHHAPEPGPDEDGESQRYPGRGQYVFEVNDGWTTERGVETGDVLRFEL
jgi:uncharacterized membrane protein (UPF0127 family)